MSTQNVTVARFARNVEWDFFVIFKHCVAVGNEIAIPFKCKNVELTLSKEEEELFEVIKKSWVLKIILESDEESAWGDD